MTILRSALLMLALALVVAACATDEGDVAVDAEPDDDAAAEPAPDDDDEEPEPQEPRELTLAYSAGVPQLEKIPTDIALDTLDQGGFDVDILRLESSTDPINAVARGGADFGSASGAAVFTAIGQGAPVVAIMQANSPTFVMVAPTGTEHPGNLDDLRFGIHAEISSTALYLAVATADFPEVEPQVLVVPGSANRIEAMGVGELDSSVVMLADLPRLEELAPGEFEVIWNFAEENADLVDSVIFTHVDTLAENPELVETFIENQLDTFDFVYDNVDVLADWIDRTVPDIEGDLAVELAQLHADSGVWPRDGGLTPEGVQLTIDTLVENGLMDDPPELEWAFDRTPLENVLERTGR